MKKCFRACYRFSDKVNEWLNLATKYCLYSRGPDKRGRGYGIDKNTAKILKQEFDALGGVEKVRQKLCGMRLLELQVGEKIDEFPVGNNAISFENAIEHAYRFTEKWGTQPAYVGLFPNLKDANKSLTNREGYVEEYKISGIYEIML